MATLKLQIKAPTRPTRYKFIRYEKTDKDMYSYAATAIGWAGKKKDLCPNPLWFLSTNYVVRIELQEGDIDEKRKSRCIVK